MPVVLLSLADYMLDVPLCWRMMSAGLLGTPAELRTVLPQEGKKVETYPFCECIQVPLCVFMHTCATLETDTRHGFQLSKRQCASSAFWTILVPNFSSIAFNASNQRVWTREWKPSFYEDNTLHCALYGLAILLNGDQSLT